MLMSTSRRMMKRRSLNPNHIQAVSKEPVSGILKAAIMLARARVSDEKASIMARLELRPWVYCVSARMGSSFSSGTLGSSAAGQPAPQSRVTSSVGSVGKSKNTVCLLIENDEQMAIACVGMADVNIQITLGISVEV